MTRIRNRTLHWGFVVLLTGFAASATAQQELFTYRERVFDASSVRDPAVVVDYRIRFDITALSASVLLPVRLTLPDGRQYELVPEEIEDRGADSLLWRGSIVGADDDGQLTVTVHRGHVAGRLSLPGRTYELAPDAEGAGVSRLRELDTTRFPEGPDAVEPPGLPREPRGYPQGDAPSAPMGVDPVLEVLVVYTPTARAAAGGTSQMEAFIQAAVDVSNTAYGNSQVDQNLALRGTEEIGYDETGVPMSEQLVWLRNAPGIAALRDAYAADLVAMISETPPGCGIGYIMRNPGPSFAASAFSVTHRACVVGNLSFAHELGHNMGLEHDPANSDAYPNGASYPWSFAHFVDGEFRTVMAYSTECIPPGCPRVAHFSNPDVSFSGHPTGIENQRDNARTLDLTAPIVEDFRDFVTFVDVPRSHFAWASIEAVYAAGVTGGCGGDPLVYCPGSSVSRSQMAVFLLKAAEGPDYVPPPATGVFDDVPPGDPFAPWIEALADSGITGGCGTEPPLYCPDDPVSRAQMAIFLLKALEGNGYTPPPATGIFDDVPPSSPFAAWIEEIANRDITGGCSTSPPLFCPGGTANRAQMAVFLVKAFELPLPF